MDLQQTPSVKQQTDSSTFLAPSSAHARTRQNLDKGKTTFYVSDFCLTCETTVFRSYP